MPHFLSSLHLTELDLNYLDIHDRGGGAIALAPPDTPLIDDGDVNDAALAYELAVAARDDAILGFMAHPTITNALSGIGGADGDSVSVAPPTLCTLLQAILQPPLSLSLERLDAAIMLDDAEAIEEEVVGSLGEPDVAVLSVLRQSFIDGAAGMCPQLQWLRLRNWHGIAMDELLSGTAHDDSAVSSRMWVATASETGGDSAGLTGHREYSRLAPGAAF